MDALAKYVQDKTEGRIDFVGQLAVEQIARVVLIGSAIIAFIVGFAMQSLLLTFGILGTAVVVLALIVLPAWPMFNTHAVEWLPTVSVERPKNIDSLQ